MRNFCHCAEMHDVEPFTARLVETLYCEALVLADDARSFFHDGEERVANGVATPVQRVNRSCEALRVTTRLLHSIAWLLHQKSYFAGEISERDLDHRNRSLGAASPSDPTTVALLPEEGQRLVTASEELYDRLVRLEASLRATRQGGYAAHGQQMVHAWQERLAEALTGPARQDQRAG